MGTKIQVLCVDDSADITELYATVIDAELDMCCVGMLSDVSALIEEAIRTEASVILLDLTMPGGPDPLVMLRALLEAKPDTRVLAFSGYDDEATQAKVMDAGAWGLVSKHGDPFAVISAIRRVALGEVVLPR